MVMGHTIPSVFEFVRAMLNVVQHGAPKALSCEKPRHRRALLLIGRKFLKDSEFPAAKQSFSVSLDVTIKLRYYLLT
jgi:hypothetical protein